MREIKFRGRDDHGDWYYGDLRNSFGNDYVIIENGKTFSVIPETVGQYTGINDKNETEIYEGDIVRRDDHSIFGVIKFGKYTQPFNDNADTKHIGFYVDWTDMFRRDLGYWAEKCTVIGNVHDTPELMEEE